VIRVVIDTNVVVSASLRDEGLPAAILDLASARIIRMCVSAELLAEYKEVLNRPRFRLLPRRNANSLSVIRRTSILVKPATRLSISADEADNRVLECAQAATADYIVTGNTRHFPGRFEGTHVVTPRQFIDRILPILARIN
jgi:putative PIN family toxin of toxin-antitoxin system